MDHLTEQDAGLLEQGASMLEEHAEEQRTRGNCSAAEGAACSAHAIRRLAPAMLRAGRGCLAQIEEPAKPARIVLDNNWKARMLDGRAPERDEMGLGDHPELPWLDEGMMPRSFFAALGLELAHTSAEDQLDGDVLGAMSEAVNWSRWMPTAPQGDGWKLVSIFDTEDGPAAWWLRALPEAEDGTTTIRNLQAEVEKLKVRIARAGAAPAAVAPFGYVNTHTSQFFTDVEPCRKNNEGHWRTVYLQPAAVAPQVVPVGVIRASSEIGVAPWADIWQWLEPGTELYAEQHAAVAGPAPTGWRLVPAVPTREWIAAVADDGYFDVDCAQLIANILSHAPAAPALEAPAHQCCNSWFLSLPEGRQAVLRENQWMLADAAYQAGRESRSALEAPAAPAVPPGFALVPIEPTQQMLDAGRWSGAGSVSIQEEWARKEVWSRMLATITPPPAAYTDDLVALVENLAQALSAAAPGNDLAGHALDYLKRNGLQGSPLQAAEAAPQAPNCTRCSGSGEDPEGYLTHGRGPDDHTVDGPCRECDGTGAAPQAPAAPSGMPHGWVPCILTHDGQHPEEVAYGPQIMMDRLKKWLGRYFELLAQKVLAEPVHAEMLAALQAVGLDVVHVGAGENAISDAARAKVEAVLEKIGAPWPSPVAAPAAPAVNAELPSWWPAFIQCVAELPDRNSPEDEPDAMIATAEELGSCARAAQAKEGSAAA